MIKTMKSLKSIRNIQIKTVVSALLMWSFALGMTQAQTTSDLSATVKPSPAVLVGNERTLIMTYAQDEGADAVDIKPRPGQMTKIYKSRSGNSRDFKEIGQVSFPATARELGLTLRDRVLEDDVLTRLNVKTVPEAFRILTEHGTDTLGLLLLSPDLAEALGLMFIDHHGQAAEALSSIYRLDVLDAGGQVIRHTYLRGEESSLLWGGEPMLTKEYLPLDSSVTITWESKLLYNQEGLPLFANVYRRTGHQGEFTLQQRLFLTHNEETGTTEVTFNQEVTPGEHLSYFIEVEDLAGNSGLRSDTLSVLPLDVSQRHFIANLGVIDTLDGLLIRWDPIPREAMYTAIEIQKSRQPNTGYIVVDTLTADMTRYLDRKVIPSTVYYYRVRVLNFQLANMDEQLPSEAQGYKSGETHIRPSTPIRVKAAPYDEAVKITWALGDELNLFGYYVLRGPNPQNMSIISDAIQDTLFVDTLLESGFTGQMHYAVQSMDMAQQLSDTSSLTSVFIRQPVTLSAPNGLLAVEDVGGVWLEWDHVAIRDHRIYGYYVYRKELEEEYFTRINEQPLTDATLTDRQIADSKDYIYAVSATDIYGNESIFSPTAYFEKNLATRLAPPLELTLRNLNAGIEVSWPVPVSYDEETVYVIYRTDATSDNLQEVGRVRPGEKFLDQQVQSDVLYNYSVKAEWRKETGSLYSPEKSLRRR